MEQEEIPKSKKLKSWETEILISGGAIFSIVQLKSKTVEIVRIVTTFYDNELSMVAIPCLTALGILTLGFGLHLILRGFWFSVFVLEDLFPSDLASLSKRTKKLNEFCSGLFSWAVSSTAMFFGLAIPYFGLLFLSSMQGEKNQLMKFVILFLSTTFILFLVDLIFFNVLSRVKYVKRIFRPVYWFWDKLSLGFIWRPSLHVIFTNISNRFTFRLVTVLIIVGGFIYFILSESDFGWEGFYQHQGELSLIRTGTGAYLDTRRTDFWNTRPAIQSDVITDNFLKIRVPRNPSLQMLQKSALLPKKYQSELIKIKIDDSTFTDLKWVHYDQPNMQQSIQTVVDIRDLKNGYHQLSIEYIGDNIPVIIPFWKE
ncbi:MAG TPA: hypothetical protein DGG95_00305 [Cytophagales bacterium]|jgi:hypothetical protein|nr:hypothetical protein [Cytophagales bacterium]